MSSMKDSEPYSLFCSKGTGEAAVPELSDESSSGKKDSRERLPRLEAEVAL